MRHATINAPGRVHTVALTAAVTAAVLTVQCSCTCLRSAHHAAAWLPALVCTAPFLIFFGSVLGGTSTSSTLPQCCWSSHQTQKMYAAVPNLSQLRLFNDEPAIMANLLQCTTAPVRASSAAHQLTSLPASTAERLTAMCNPVPAKHAGTALRVHAHPGCQLLISCCCS